MKMHLNRTLVVEGKEDASYLSNYIDSEIVIVNGFELDNKTISYLKDKPVILLLDPDKSGIEIRQKLHTLLNNFLDVEIDINKCKKGKKTGVAECEIDELLSKLRPFDAKKVAAEQDISSSILFELGLANNKDLREYVCLKLNLGKCNFKTFLKRININKINVDTIREIIKGYRNGNK